MNGALRCAFVSVVSCCASRCALCCALVLRSCVAPSYVLRGGHQTQPEAFPISLRFRTFPGCLPIVLSRRKELFRLPFRARRALHFLQKQATRRQRWTDAAGKDGAPKNFRNAPSCLRVFRLNAGRRSACPGAGKQALHASRSGDSPAVSHRSTTRPHDLQRRLRPAVTRRCTAWNRRSSPSGPGLADSTRTRATSPGVFPWLPGGRLTFP